MDSPIDFTMAVALMYIGGICILLIISGIIYYIGKRISKDNKKIIN